MQPVQCSRCGKPKDLDVPVVFRHEDNSPMEPEDRPQPWLRMTLASLQPSYVLPDGSQWPAQERTLCDDCTPLVLGVLTKDFAGTSNVKEHLFDEPPLEAAVELATKVDPVPEPVEEVVAEEVALDEVAVP